MSKQGIYLPCLIGGGSPITDEDKPIFLFKRSFFIMDTTEERHSIYLLISLLREMQEIDEMLDISESIDFRSFDSKQMISNGLSDSISINEKAQSLKLSLGYPSYMDVSESQLLSRLSRLA